MGFLFPSFLWGLLAVSVPIAIHIFNFRRTKKVYFTNVAFLKAVETKTRSVRQVKHWLVLAARILAIICLALAFAQPFLPAQNNVAVDRKGITSLYLDNSLSMESELNNKRYLDIATARLSELLGLFRNATSLQLVTNEFSAQEQGLYASEKLRDRLTTIGLSNTPRTFDQIYKRQENLMARHQHPGKNQLFWFSDFQKSTSGNLSGLKTDTTNQLFLVPVQAAAEKNVFVDSAWLNTPFIRELQNNILFVKVSNSGSEAARNVVLKLNLDNTQASTASVNVPANGSATAKFNFNLKGKGYKKGQITFDDFPVTFDNNYYFVLNASPLIRVLHIYGQKSAGNYVENVYANDSLFSLQSYSANNVDPGLIKNTDLVILEGVTSLSGSLPQDLQELIRNGGSVTVIPPAAPSTESYNGFLSRLGVNGLTGTQNADPAPVAFAAPDRNNPFFSDVFEESVRQELNLNLPSASPVWSWANAGQMVLALRNGQTYLNQVTSGTGKLYLFAAPLNPEYGNIAQHAIFVPIMYKIAASSVRAQRTSCKFDENPISLNVEKAQPNTVYKLRRNKTEVIPVQRIAGNQLLLEIPQGDQLGEGLDAGYFELIKDNKVEQIIALNHNNAESKLQYYSPDELRTIFAGQKNIQIFDRIDDDAFSTAFQQQNMGTNLWKYFLYAALFFLLVEIALIRFLK
ncbi:BatA domain-containing protein [Dyadobacter psychrophilus]|uniref:N-terminal double-transmembrane domain-containing protein n=1 Tax=Dyadobacter psychrophilus TaxID=651661 RepID=A0A1T5F857_9BACT|nr:BatA domain-containing protein [Dyadobacter psychrophilus]SKB92346.1 N-terminal double-transmembrane domain-containing protein [Dyadobacter psychrophilus]